MTKVVAKELPPVTPVVQMAVKEVVGEKSDLALVPEDVEESVKDAVREGVKEAVINVVEEVWSRRLREGSSQMEPAPFDGEACGKPVQSRAIGAIV